jgi:nitrate reductase assembly molybdenum cofactor insertion protein NarJ
MNDTSSPDLFRLATLVDYPTTGFSAAVNAIQLLLNEKYPSLASALRPFTYFASTASIDEMQELYVRTFEVQAVTTLDLGYLLFGDDYKRAELLVNLNREHSLAGNNCGTELADHLPNVIRLVARMQDEPIRRELVEKLICPGLQKMISEFEPFALERKNEVYKRHHQTLIEVPGGYGTLYQWPLTILLELIREEFEVQIDDGGRSSRFLHSINTEMTLEE